MNAEQMTTLEKKIGHFSRILSTRPDDELTILALAEASFRRGLKLEALTAYQAVGSGRPVPEAHLAVAEIYSAQGMPHEAYGELRRLFELNPENVEARLLVNALQEDALPPEEVRAIMERPTTEEAFDEARLRLKIQRAIYNRELQERTRNVTLEPGTVVHEYHMEEAKKKLIRVDELLRELERFREYNQTLGIEEPEPEPPRAEPIASQAEPLDDSAASDVPVVESFETEPAPVLDELPIEMTAGQESAELGDASQEMSPPQATENPETVAAPTAEAHPTFNIAPEQETVTVKEDAELAPLATGLAEQTAEVAPAAQAEPVAPQPPMPTPTEQIAEVAPQAVAPIQTEQTAEAASQPVAPTQTEQAYEVAPQPVAPTQTEQANEAAPQPIAPTQTEHAAEASPQPIAPTQTEQANEAAPQPVAPTQTEQANEVAPQPVAPTQTEQANEVVPQPLAPTQTEQANEAAPQPVAPTQTEQANEVALQPVAPTQTEQANDVAPQPVAPSQEDSHASAEAPLSSVEGPAAAETGGLDVEKDLASAEREPAPHPGLDMGPLAISAIAPPAQPSFASDFRLSMDSPVDPDLPDLSVDLPSEEEVSSMVDLAPISMSTEEVPPAVVPPPTFDDAPVRPEPTSFTPISMVDDSTMILTAPENPLPPRTADLVAPSGAESVEPEPLPVAETSVEPTYSSAEAEVPQSLSPARKAFYETHSEALSGLTTTLARTRGVTSIYLVAREGVTIDSVAKDEISEKRVGDLVRESFEFLEAFASDPAYWVLECAGGIFVMQKLDDRHVLIAIGQAGANFGALRYTMDKTRTKFEQLLAQAPQ